MRVYAGVGMPYLNSTVLPYVEQFFSEGAYSIRGFKARSLGPGSFHEEETTYIDPDRNSSSTLFPVNWLWGQEWG